MACVAQHQHADGNDGVGEQSSNRDQFHDRLQLKRDRSRHRERGKDHVRNVRDLKILFRLYPSYKFLPTPTILMIAPWFKISHRALISIVTIRSQRNEWKDLAQTDQKCYTSQCRAHLLKVLSKANVELICFRYCCKKASDFWPPARREIKKQKDGIADS